MIKLSDYENSVSERIKELKRASGTHSPSIFTLVESIREVSVEIDACFLSNPYATDLFMDNLKKDLMNGDEFRKVLEFYPSQNNVISEVIGKAIGLPKGNIFVGNGAIEVIQAVAHNFIKNKVVVNIPTFSSYYEFLNSDVDVAYYQLDKSNDYNLNVQDYISYVVKEKPDSVVIINPNNPNGGYISTSDLRFIFEQLSWVDNIILDESFVHFAYENEGLGLISCAKFIEEFKNLILIKSMSKDFGVAGVRAGYGVMSEDKVSALTKNGYLWNSNGLNEYFFNLYSDKQFFEEYDLVRKKYIVETKEFFDDLKKINQIKVYPSMANFALVELLDGSKAEDFVSKLLIQSGVYTRVCNDKIGLDGEFIRIASRTREENKIIVKAIKKLFE